MIVSERDVLGTRKTYEQLFVLEFQAFRSKTKML